MLPPTFYTPLATLSGESASVPTTPRSTTDSVAGSCAGSIYSDIFAPDMGTLMSRAELSLAKGVQRNHTAFAKLIALELGTSNYAVEKIDKENLVIQWFDGRNRVWVRGGGARNLHDVATETLYRLFSHLSEEVKANFGNKGFISPVVDLLKNHLQRDGTSQMPPLDGDQTRGLLRFSCGSVFDFRTGAVRPCTPEDRISLCTGYRYSDWDCNPDTKGFLTQLCADLNELWEQDADIDQLEHIEERLDRAVQESTLYRIVYGLFEDHSVALWMMRQFVRAAAGLGGYEEILFMVDPRGTNGKGTLLNILKAILGATSGSGYYGSLEYAKHFLGTGAARMNINNPDIAALSGKRAVAVNESPHEGGASGSSHVFNTTLCKSLASGDEPILASAKYKDPMSFQPQCLLLFCTNSNPEFPANDGGFKSRVSWVNMPFEWVADPTQPGQRRIDVSIKEQVVKTLQPEFLFWAKLLAPGLLRPKCRHGMFLFCVCCVLCSCNCIFVLCCIVFV